MNPGSLYFEFSALPIEPTHHPKLVIACIGTQPALFSDCEEVKKDTDRCDAFSNISFTLSKLAGTQLQLPDTAQLLDIFGKVGHLAIIIIIMGTYLHLSS